MSRRIEIELTSQRSDGSWTWRAVGAREPKGEIAGHLIGFPASVGDELTVEADFHLDGIEIVEAHKQQPKNSPMAETLEVLGSHRDQPLVTTQLVATRKGQDKKLQDKQKRNKHKEKDGQRSQDSRQRADAPKFKRLRPQRVHREAFIAASKKPPRNKTPPRNHKHLRNHKQQAHKKPPMPHKLQIPRLPIQQLQQMPAVTWKQHASCYLR